MRAPPLPDSAPAVGPGGRHDDFWLPTVVFTTVLQREIDGGKVWEREEGRHAAKDHGQGSNPRSLRCEGPGLNGTPWKKMELNTSVCILGS